MSGRKILRRFSSSISDLLSLQRKASTEEEENGTPLHTAVRLGNGVMVKNLLDNKLVWIDEEDGKGRTALHYATEQSNLDIASLLLSSGANVDCVDFNGVSACHLAAKDGMIDVFDLLMYYKCDACGVDKSGKTAFDFACEYGKEKMIERFFEIGVPLTLLQNSGLQHSASAMHLAARMGHVNVILRLLEHGWNLNRTTSLGTSLHDAAANGRIQVVRFLLHAGIDTSLTNSNGQTAAEYAKKYQQRNPITYKEIRFLLKEHRNFVYGQAQREHLGIRADELSFNKDDIIWIIERGSANDPRWKGVIFGQKANSRSGFFNGNAVKIVGQPPPVISMSSRVACGSNGSGMPSVNGGPPRQAKKVCVPVVPNMAVVNRGCEDRGNRALSCRSLASPSHLSDDRSSDSQNGNRTLRPQMLNMNTTSTFSTFGVDNSGLHGKPTGMSYPSTAGILAETSHRNSTGSNSSQGSSGFGSMKSSTVASSSSFNTTSLTPSSHLDSPPSRISVHSSGSAGSGPSSLASCSVDTLDDSSYGSFHETPINVTAMVSKGVPEAEIIALWLERLSMSEYLSLFLTQGYDLSSIARITPEDLCALGIASPTHRKKLMNEIHAWQITDSWPCSPPPGGLREWLCSLALPEYSGMFETQGYETVEEVMKLSWEDFEDIGIKRLGHLKRLGLAIKKLKDMRRPQCPSVETSSGFKLLQPSAPSPAVGRARPMDPPPPAPPSARSAAPSSSIDYISYARGNNKNAPPPPMRSSTDCYSSMDAERRRSAKSSNYDGLFDKCEPIKLNLISTGKILSDASRDSGSHFPSDPMPPGADCPPPPAPLFCEGSIRRLQSVTSSSCSSGSMTSLEQLPFANENCGTIRSRDYHRTAPTTPTHSQLKFSTVDEQRGKESNGTSSQNGNVLNDIGFMLQNLTDELDAMLSPPKTSNGFPNK